MTPHPLLVALLVAMFAAWLLAGLGDWLSHRRTHIETTSGPKESALHLLLHLLIAAPIVLGLFLRIDALVLVLMALSVLTHTAVALWDTSYSQPRRYISPLEQQIHSHLEMWPLFGLAVVVVLHWNEVNDPEWLLERRATALPSSWVAAVLAGLGAGLAPLLFAQVQASAGTTAISFILAAFCLLTVLCTLALRETSRTSLTGDLSAERGTGQLAGSPGTDVAPA